MSITLILLVNISVRAQQLTDSCSNKDKKLNEVVVVGSSNQITHSLGKIFVDIKNKNNNSSLFGEADVLKALQPLPGVSTGIEGFSGLYVRGGENDENLYMLGNLPVYNTSHAFGLLSSFNPSVIDNIDLYKSTFPVEYGGKASSVVCLNMKGSDYQHAHGQITVGLLSGNGSFTMPLIKDKLAFTLALRRSWVDVLACPALWVINKLSDGTDKIVNYNFTDANLKFDYNLGAKFKGYTQFYWNHDKSKFGDKFKSKEQTDYFSKSVTEMSLGNIGVASALSYRINDRQSLDGDIYYIKYNSAYSKSDDESEIVDGKTQSTYCHDNNQNGLTDIGATFKYNLRINSLLNMKIGANYIFHNYKPERVWAVTSEGTYYDNDSQPTVKANELALFFNNSMSFGKYVGTNLGLRYSLYFSNGKAYRLLEPRVSAQVFVSDNFSILLGYNRVHQFSQQVCNSFISLPTDAWIPISDRWEPLKSDQFSLGIQQHFNNGLWISVEGYYKKLSNVLAYKDGYNSFSMSERWDDKLTSGCGEVYGVDIFMKKNFNRLSATLGYGLMWNNRTFEDINGGKTFPAKFDNRHKINVSMMYRFSDAVTFNADWTYVTGNRITLALYHYKDVYNSGFSLSDAPGIYSAPWGNGYYQSRNNVRLPSYHRLDLGISVKKKLKHNGTRIWNFGLYNAYCHMNAMAITKSAILNCEPMKGKKWDTKFQTVTLLPILPSVSYTYQF